MQPPANPSPGNAPKDPIQEPLWWKVARKRSLARSRGCRFGPQEPPAGSAGAVGWVARGHPGMQLWASVRTCARRGEIPRAAALSWRREEGWDVALEGDRLFC